MKSVKSLKMKIFMVMFVIALCCYKTFASTILDASSSSSSNRSSPVVAIANDILSQKGATLSEEKIQQQQQQQNSSLPKSGEEGEEHKKLQHPIWNGHRRRTTNQWKSKVSDECERDCKIVNNDEYCKLKCFRDIKMNADKDSNEMSTRDLNLVVQLSKGMMNNIEESPLVDATKKSINVNNHAVNNANTKENLNVKNHSFNHTSRATTATKVNRRKYTRTSLLPINHTRPTSSFRGRVKYSPSSLRILKEEDDPYLSSTRRYSDIRKMVPTRKIILPNTTTTTTTTTAHSKSKEEEEDDLEVSAPKQSSTEKSKFWKARNIVAINNYMRRLKDLSLSSSSSSMKVKLTTARYEPPPPVIKKKNVTLLINIPDDASPLFPYENDAYDNATMALLPTTTTTEIADISNLFDMATTHADRNLVYEQNEAPTVASTTQKTTKKIYTTIPRRKSTTPSTSTATAAATAAAATAAVETKVFSTSDIIISSTISSFLNNVSSKRERPSDRTTTPKDQHQPARAPSSTATTVKYIFTNTKVPPLIINQIHSDFPVGEITTTARARTNNISEVLAEPQKINTTLYYVLGLLALLPLIIFVAYVTKQYFIKNIHKEDAENYGNDIQPISPVVTFDHSDDGTCSDGEESVITESGLNRNKLRFKSLLGEGNFGQVWKAEIDDLPGFTGTKIVAVKTERSINRSTGGLKAECEIMRKLGTHQNVVKLIAGCTLKEPHLLIMEFAMRGRLLSLLRTARSLLNGSSYNTQNHHQAAVMPLSPRRLTGFALDIAKGMEYISEKRIVHCDLAARNILLDHNGVCKICDFGMSIDLDKVKTSENQQMKIPRVSTHHQSNFKFDMTTRVFGGLKNYAFSKTRNSGGNNNNNSNNNANFDFKSRAAMPVRWMAPEALKFHIYSVETDVYAYGILAWEIASFGITPYPTLSGRQVIRGVMNGLRPEIPISCNENLGNVMQQCWHKDSGLRPSFSDIKKSLSAVLSNWQEDTSSSHTEFLDVSGFSEDYENGMIYFNRRISEFECEI